MKNTDEKPIKRTTSTSQKPPNVVVNKPSTSNGNPIITIAIWCILIGAAVYYFTRPGNRDMPTETETPVALDTSASTNYTKTREEDSFDKSIHSYQPTTPKTDYTTGDGESDFFASLDAVLPPNHATAYAWITYKVKRFKEVPRKVLIPEATVNGVYQAPVYSEERSIPYYDTFVFYTKLITFNEWSADVKYKLMDETEASLIESEKFSNKGAIQIVKRQAFVFPSYADASKNLEHRKENYEQQLRQY